MGTPSRSFRLGSGGVTSFSSPRQEAFGNPDKKFSAKGFVRALLDTEQGIAKELSAGQRAQLEALSGESDAAIFWSDLFAFGRSLENAEKFDAASNV